MPRKSEPVAAPKPQVDLSIEMEVLLFLSRNGNTSSTKDACLFLSKTAPVVSGAFVTLTRKGFVRKEVRRNRETGRITEYTLTKEGIMELIRLRSLLDYSLRKKTSSVQRTDPMFVGVR